MPEQQEYTQTHHFAFFSDILTPLTWMKLIHDSWDITAEIQTTKLTQLGPDRVHWRVCINLYEHKYPFYGPYPSYDHIQDMPFTFMGKILVVHIPVHLIITSFLVSDYCIVFVHASVVFIVYNTNSGSIEK